MIASVINGVTIFVMGILGSLIKQRLNLKYKTIVMHGIGLAVVFVGASGAIKNLTAPEANPVLFVVSLVVGGALGALIGITNHLNVFGEWVQKKFSKKFDGQGEGFAAGFIYATILFCVGTMAIIGSFDSGVKGDYTILLVKSVIDGISALIIGASLGIGVAFSGVMVFLYEGLLTLLAGLVSPYISADMMREMSIVGGIIISAIGLDMLNIVKIKVADFLPAVFIPIIYYLALGFMK